MPSVFLSHSSRDKPFVRNLAEYIQQDSRFKVWLDEREIAPGANIVSEIADGLNSDFVLLILSPDSVESNWVKEEWTDAFWEQTNNQRAKLAGVLYRDCQVPRLLRNKKYFDLRSNHPEGFRQILTWLQTERPVPPPHINPLPTRPPLFIGREVGLEFLSKSLQPGVLVALSAMPGAGKTTLALEFAHRAQTQFDSVYWLPCESGSLASVAGDLTRQLNLSLTGDLPQILAELRLVCARHRYLLILDNVDTENLAALIPGGASSVLVTTRLPGLRFLRNHPELRLELFTEQQCFELFRRVIGEREVNSNEAACRKLFQRAGYLPIAINLSANAIKYDSYTISSLAANFPSDVTTLISKAIQALPHEPRHLLTAMSACAPGGFGLALAASLAELDETAALPSLRYLVARSLVEETNLDQRRYRLHALIRQVADGGHFAERHAEAVQKLFEKWETDWQTCEQDLPDLQVALDWALANDAPFTESLAFSGAELTRRIGRLSESLEIHQRMTRAAKVRKDQDAEQRWLGNQALILGAWGRLDEAHALHKQNEAICRELGNKDGLGISLGNQALILRAWGRLDEALALHKQEEAICRELGSKDGLQACLGNQGLILQAWGRLDEALALFKQKEVICRELGNKASLGYCYWNWGLLARAQNDRATEQEKLRAALALFTELNMPRERDAVTAELDQANAAGAS